MVALHGLIKQVGKSKKRIYPTTNKNNKIDFEFMDVINKTRRGANKELSAYLTSGLDNYELSSEEKEALEKFENLECKEFKIGDLFDISTIKF